MQQALSGPEHRGLLENIDEAVLDHRKALAMAAELRSVGAHDTALIWARLANFLRDSEDYLREERGPSDLAKLFNLPR
jgi:hypothetical protein